MELAYSTELQHRTTFQHFPVYVSITITDKNISSSTLVTIPWILLLVLKVFWNQKSKKELRSSVPLGSDYFCSSIFKKCQDSYSLLHLHYLEFIITRWGPLLAALHLDSVTEYFLDMMSDVCSRKDWKNEFLPGNYILKRTNLEPLMFKEIELNEWLQICNQHFTAYVYAGWLVYTRHRGQNHEFLLFMEYQMDSLVGNGRFLFLSVSLMLGRDSSVPSATTIMFHVWLGLQARGKHDISLQKINVLHSPVMENWS